MPEASSEFSALERIILLGYCLDQDQELLPLLEIQQTCSRDSLIQKVSLFAGNQSLFDGFADGISR